MFAESALIELAIKWGGGLLALIVGACSLWLGGKRSGRKQRQQEIDRERHKETERALDIETDVNRGGADAARDSLRNRIDDD